MRNEGLVRVIGPGALGLGVVNMVVGAGIFVLPGRIAAELGSAAILAYLVCSVAVVLVFLCFAEVGSRTTRSGGAYAYIEEAFGPLAGFIASILFWFGYSALSDVAMIEVMTIAFPVLDESIPRAMFIVGWLLLQVPAEEAISIAALISASVVVYVIRARVRGSWSGKPKV